MPRRSIHLFFWAFFTIMLLLVLTAVGRPTLATVSQFRPADLTPLQNIAQVATGDGHTCALTTAGGVKCWGGNGYGQLGDGTFSAKSTAVAVIGLSSGVTALTASHTNTCALTSGGGVKCWGLGYQAVPVNAESLTSDVVSVVNGGSHTCVLLNSGGVKCWGRNHFGQLGAGTTTDSMPLVDVVGLSAGVSALAAGYYHTCALLNSGTVQCWGHNHEGQLGDGTTTDQNQPVAVPGLSDVRKIATGDDHTCGLLNNGGVKCWGSNQYGKLGDGTHTSQVTPTDVAGLGSGVQAIAGGGQHACALLNNGGVKCWGRNESGQLSDGTTINRGTPVDVVGLRSGVRALDAGYDQTCAVLSEGSVQCWGNNEWGQLGDATPSGYTAPVDVVGLRTGVITITANSTHTCALTSAGGVKCWGANSSGELGDGSIDHRMTPVDVVGLTSDVRAIAAGQHHTCALLSSGAGETSVKCWGGPPGNGQSGWIATPIEVAGLSAEVQALAAGEFHTCALLSNGGVQCWGSNGFGELGDGTTTNQTTPVAVVGLSSGVRALTAYSAHTCALLDSGPEGSPAKCWGANNIGQLGDGTTLTRTTPVDVVGLGNDVRALTMGIHHTCALLNSGAVKCWGENNVNQLGDGTHSNHNTQVDVVGLSTGVRAIGAGARHTCAALNGGRVKCWGHNDKGQLGSSGNVNGTPADVVGLSTEVSALAAGEYHTCALLSSGAVQCWGSNFYGQLGDGNAWHTAPVDVVEVTISTPTPTPSPSPGPGTPTHTPAPTDPDAYEDNDLCEQAKALTTDGIAQAHTFQQTADVDWVRFAAVQGTQYRIEVEIPYGSPADVNLALYADCGALVLEQWHETFTPGVRLTFSATTTAPVYLKLANVDATVYGTQATYQLSVRALGAERQVGAAIIVAGRLRGGDKLQTNIHNVTDAVYKLLQANRYTNDDIYYLATNSTLSGYDAAATVTNLQAAITTWAVPHVGTERALTIYMMDHGGIGKFYLDDLNQEYVTPTQLNDWLTQLETQVPGLKINLIIEACHAGSFIRTTPSLSKAGRIIIASTNSDNDAYASRFGAHFSDQFLVALSQGINLYSSFWHARTTVNRLYSLQDPWLDADGDQIPNELDDATLAAERGFGQSGTFDSVWPPFIVPIQASVPISAGRGVIEVEVRDNEAVASVWAVIYPPAYQPTQSGEELVAEALDTILLQPQGNDRYRAPYAGFLEPGRYRVVIHAEDAQKLEAQPLLLDVENGSQLFLPLIVR